jgi:2'-5' RNA ligase
MTGGRTDLFLIPEEGAAEITALHDRLYAAALRPHLRPEIAFVPHLTVGGAADPLAAEKLRDEFRLGFESVPGRVTRLELIDVGAHVVQPLGAFQLGNGE